MVVIKFFLLVFISGIALHCNLQKDEHFDIAKDPEFPRWLKSGSYQSEQTSGISFIGNDSTGNDVFLLADDIGSIHKLIIENDTIFHLIPVVLSQRLRSYFNAYPKADFEEITYDKYEGKVYLSVEGNYPDPKKYTGIFELNFADNDISNDTVVSVTKIKITPSEEFERYLDNNIGYEGLAVDRNYLYLGLEGFAKNGVYADSTIIFIVDKNTKKIVKEISTKPFGIVTVCGLFSDKDYSLWGIDRNNKTLFRLKLDQSLNVTSYKKIKLKSNIPYYNAFDYVASLESITMDNKQNVFLVDDPWRKFFIPSEGVLDKLDSNTVKNFRNFTPVIFKYNLKY